MLIKKVGKKELEQFKREWKNHHKELGFEWKETEYCFGAFEGRKLVGYAKFFTNGGVSHLQDLMVKKAFRHRL